MLLASSSVSSAGRPGTLKLRQGYPRLAVLRTGFPPADPAALEIVYRNLALADLVVLPGNRGKWWAFPTDAAGLTLRDYNPRTKLLQYLAVHTFPAVPPTENEITPPPTDPGAAFTSGTFSRGEFYGIALAVGRTILPPSKEIHPQWDAAIHDVEYGGFYANRVYANWNSPAYRAYVKRAMGEVQAAGFDGMFFDFGGATWLSFQNTHTIVMPPDCFRLKETGAWYWMSLPGERFQDSGPPPSIESLRALDPAAIAEIADVDYCATTSVPVEVRTLEDAEAMIDGFYADLKASSPLLLIWNGVHEGMPRRNDVVLAHSDGGHQEGFALRERTPAELRRELDMVESFNAKGKIFVAWNRSAPQDAAGLTYGYAGCMMAGGPLTFCEFSEAVPDIPLIRADPGKPRGRYVKLPAGVTDLDRLVYKRVFTKLVLYLNPTVSTISVEGVTLPAKTALILPR